MEALKKFLLIVLFVAIGIVLDREHTRYVIKKRLVDYTQQDLPPLCEDKCKDHYGPISMCANYCLSCSGDGDVSLAYSAVQDIVYIQEQGFSDKASFILNAEVLKVIKGNLSVGDRIQINIEHRYFPGTKSRECLRTYKEGKCTLEWVDFDREPIGHAQSIVFLDQKIENNIFQSCLQITFLEGKIYRSLTCQDENTCGKHTNEMGMVLYKPQFLKLQEGETFTVAHLERELSLAAQKAGGQPVKLEIKELDLNIK